MRAATKVLPTAVSVPTTNRPGGLARRPLLLREGFFTMEARLGGMDATLATPRYSLQGAALLAMRRQWNEAMGHGWDGFDGLVLIRVGEGNETRLDGRRWMGRIVAALESALRRTASRGGQEGTAAR
jgi:hypothetical protein